MKKLLNSKGSSLIGVMITAGIGLLVVLGLSKGLINFTQQTSNISRKADISITKQNIVASLRDIDMWKYSLSKAKGKIPGKDTAIKLYHPNSSKVWMCRRKGGGLSNGVIIISENGLAMDLNCGKCASDDNCGYDKKKFSRIELDVTANDELRPSFDGFIYDSAGSKTKTEISSKSANEELYDEKQVSCPDGQVLVKVEKGKPVCMDPLEGVRGTACRAGYVMVGLNKNGTLQCAHIKTVLKKGNAPVVKGKVSVYQGPYTRRIHDKWIGKHAYCALAQAHTGHEVQACGCNVTRRGNNWVLHTNLDNGVYGFCACRAICLD